MNLCTRTQQIVGNYCSRVSIGVYVIYVLLAAMTPPAQAQAITSANDETIVLIRHGEKPSPALGQLSCKGLNRALALPEVLAVYGKPTAIYAPNPSVQVKEGNDAEDAPRYSYVRPLITIEPYAIRIGMPVNTQIGYNELDKLQTAVLQPAYAHATVLIAWEHLQSVLFARQLLRQFGEDPSVVPKWLNSDYDTVYIFHLKEDSKGKQQLQFNLSHEGLDGRLSDACPGPALAPLPK
jgi:hypothetical protein